MRQYRDDQIVDLIDQYMMSSQNADLLGYRTQSQEREYADKSRFLWTRKHVAGLGDYRNKRILDVGCGFGWHAFCFSLLDDGNDVVGIDILPSMIDGMSDCVEAMRAKGVSFKLTPVQGDICEAAFAPNSFDAIHSNESIEHVHDIETMIDRCYSLLRPGGNLILINDQNVFNAEGRADTVAMWEKREHSLEWCDYLKSIRPIEHADAKPFAVMRHDIIKARRPDIDATTAVALAEATAGMRRREIEDVAAKHTPGASLPQRPELDWCRNPETGEYAERLFDPFALADKMRARGFKTSVRHLFRKFPLNLVNPIQFRPLNIAMFNVRPPFVLYGEKR